MINRIVLLGKIEGGLGFATTGKGDKVAYFMLRTWHKWFDAVTRQQKSKSETHLIATLRPDLVGMLERRATISGLVFVEGALSGVMDFNDNGRLRSAVMVYKDGQIRFIGSGGEDEALQDVRTESIQA